MVKRFRSYAAFALLFLVVLFTTGCEKITSDSGHSNQDFEKLTRELFCREVSSNTISLHYTLQNPEEYGIKAQQASFGNCDVSQTAQKTVIENESAALDRFSKENLSVENKLTYDVLRYYLDMADKGVSYCLYEEPLSPVNGAQTQIPLLLSEYRLQETEDVKTYLQLMESVPAYLESVEVFEKKKAAAGLLMSDAILGMVVDQCEAFVNMKENNYLYATFVERLNAMEQLDGQEKDAYIRDNAKAVAEYVLPAYDKLIAELKSMMGKGTNKNGLCYFPEGKSYYEWLAVKQTGSSKTVTQMQEATKAQMLSDLEDMEKILGLGTDQAKETAALPGDNPVTMLNDLEKNTEKYFPKAPAVTSRIKYVPTALEEHMSPAFYMIPTIDNVTENIIYVNKSQMQNNLMLYTTLAHEGYPGHLYQTMYYSNQNPSPIRQILDFGGYVEGWATYSEMMSYYFAPLTSEQAVLLQKNSSFILGLYALADMGIHYDGWTFYDTTQFFAGYGIKDADALESIWNLIIGDPGNYLKYYIGYLEFLEMKKDLMEKQGDDFSQKAYHEAVLKVGPAPFSIVKEYAVNYYLKEGVL
ncbi:DUF885 domain-containing protein [Hespellia stercorisuis]|uniref:Uncharacterized conserved protein, DUF885 familyt n=1 Tax=Hespellia stercorisuis DSM 15480 TaxID=1121950 RepID=A0A1M6SQJ3_9FIRM|nr:DUF885 domain-containing protein [Hespellia stercorisuis]SHK46907.1 Uncharacterized conserved protein, DUF885 familyt [Hespellia stercorisuis DSM 15480]